MAMGVLSLAKGDFHLYFDALYENSLTQVAFCACMRHSKMFVLGVNLPEHKLVKIALTKFVGVGHHTAKLICARLNLHSALTVGELTEHQIGRISALLSSPSTTPPPNHPLAPLDGIAPPSAIDYDSGPEAQARLLAVSVDPLQSLLIESDLRREVRANIAHHRAIGSYRGKRHALGFPVNGQRTHTNAKTAKKLNRVERRAYSILFDNRIPFGASSSILSQVQSIDSLFGFSALNNCSLPFTDCWNSTE
ncbi:hypothetical protein O181_003009 [Austropuccinia psidii MF-1]|uniref:Small ribosomal subunit protein uS13m n=1 Tax=Austropuccinia psidii MF-1 TaxID=1389203 RepID=A0A9Q3BDJ1_9BASI|nr:hypothetical protein [Austropuccinia psidii MF-1]